MTVSSQSLTRLTGQPTLNARWSNEIDGQRAIEVADIPVLIILLRHRHARRNRIAAEIGGALAAPVVADRAGERVGRRLDHAIAAAVGRPVVGLTGIASAVTVRFNLLERDK